MKDKFLGIMSILIFVSIIVNIIINIYTLNKKKKYRNIAFLYNNGRNTIT